MEEYVLFNDINTFEDFKLYIKSITISEAEIKEELIDIPGADSQLDFSEALTGDIKFNNRIIRIDLINRKDFNCLQEYSRIQNALHGKEMKVRLSRDLGFYYIGRVSVKEFETEDLLKNITIEVNAEPYKYDINSSNEDWLWDPFSFEDGIINETKDIVVNGEKEIAIYGRRKKVIPEITCDNEFKVTFNSNEYSLLPTTQKVLDIQICEGRNILTFKGNGTISISYRGGSL